MIMQEWKKIKQIRRNLYEMENTNNISAQKIKEIEKNLYKFEKHLCSLKKYSDYDDTEYKEITYLISRLMKIVIN